MEFFPLFMSLDGEIFLVVVRTLALMHLLVFFEGCFEKVELLAMVFWW
jgi:hypothetical protein